MNGKKQSGNRKSNVFLIGERIFAKLSPLQKKIMLELGQREMTLTELSERVRCSVFTAGKQLSMLQLRTKYNPLEKRGISKSLVQKRKEANKKTTYSAAEPKA